MINSVKHFEQSEWTQSAHLLNRFVRWFLRSKKLTRFVFGRTTSVHRMANSTDCVYVLFLCVSFPCMSPHWSLLLLILLVYLLGSSRVVKCTQVCSCASASSFCFIFTQFSAAFQCSVMIIFADCVYWYSMDILWNTAHTMQQQQQQQLWFKTCAKNSRARTRVRLLKCKIRCTEWVGIGWPPFVFCFFFFSFIRWALEIHRESHSLTFMQNISCCVLHFKNIKTEICVTKCSIVDACVCLLFYTGRAWIVDRECTMQVYHSMIFYLNSLILWAPSLSLCASFFPAS